VSISQAAKELGVRPETLRRWESEGKITLGAHSSGHRRYNLSQLRGLVPWTAPSTPVTICYARVSSHDQKDDLDRQAALLDSFCAANGWQFEFIRDLGSGMNYRKPGLRQLIKRICQGDVVRLVVTHKDRLLRFGADARFCLM